MNRIAHGTLNGLMIAVCVASTPLVVTGFSSSAAATPQTNGRPGRTEPGGRRAMLPQDVVRRYRNVD